ncbi:MAG: hypothetical protein HRF45_01765 [Fimbriimonadia bacterium]|jgi:hypothetical protein
MIRANRPVALSLLLLCLGFGCHDREGSQVQQPLDGALVRAEDVYWLMPEQPTPCVLHLGTESIPVMCAVTPAPDTEPDCFVLRLSAEGQEIVEYYAADREGVAFIGSGVDRFEPPIPLLQYGRQIGDEWQWAGINITEGEPAIPASASIRTSEDMLRLPGGSVQSVKVSVMMYLGGRRKPAEEMLFWFAPRLGLVRAELAGYRRTMGEGHSDDE